MGSGIAQVVAQAGLDVTIVDVDQASVDRGIARLDRSLGRLTERGKIAGDDAAAARARIDTSTDLEAAGAQADHVIETVIEELDAKVDVLRRLDAVCRDDVV